MKKLIPLLLAIMILSDVSFADDIYKSDSFVIIPPSGFVKGMVDNTHVFYKPLDGDYLYVMLTEVETTVPFFDLITGKLYDYFNAFYKLASEGKFKKLGYAQHHSDMFVAPYIMYETEDKTKIYCCFPGYGSVLCIIFIAPKDSNPIPSVNEFVYSIMIRQG